MAMCELLAFDLERLPTFAMINSFSFLVDLLLMHHFLDSWYLYWLGLVHSNVSLYNQILEADGNESSIYTATKSNSSFMRVAISSILKPSRMNIETICGFKCSHLSL